MSITFENVDWAEIWQGSLDTLTMLAFSTLFTAIIGLPLGILLFLTSRGQLLQNKALYAVLSFIVNILRSVPFIILMIMLIPLTRLIVGTSLGVQGSIPPLVIGAAPFFARLVETSLREVDRGVIEAAQSMGASKWQIIWKVLLPESRPGLIAGITITTVALVSYTAMSGAIGGGGLGDLAIRYGYQRFQTDVMIVTVVILLVLVQILQTIGDRLVAYFTRR
ncbi:methionine ABC transporter permease [Brevibacillus fulvus]|uniref:D-methionine transport system permease protein n=1 Tax=Brevibacillus fulvus TaxID=1125967 RepID=A0A939BQH0_9BACL|nr:methionine ABC transporter permease [Brevibacillus fulvus]MBM7591615.1 D-methionine transport system permease protein [Brevibacillus fulvus]